MYSILVLQARVNSSRFPAKALLPIAGMPLVVLAARRAANTGLKLIVATSKEESDDVLATTLYDYGIECYRGDLLNPLERMVEAVLGYDDDTVFVRLTGDNVFPDGGLIDEVIKEFQEKKLDYLCCNGEPSGLPYGMSLEVTKVKHLRESHDCAMDDYDREHVTPYIKRKFGLAFYKKYASLGKGHLRCTVDYFEDYLTISKLFSKVPDPVNVSGLSLLEELETMSEERMVSENVPDLVIGAAQLGMHYGITNCIGIPDEKETEALLKTAINNGVQYIDTARAYGQSEGRIASCLGAVWLDRVTIMTKLSPFTSVPLRHLCDSVQAYVEASVYESCLKLGKPSLDVLLLHRAEHLHACDGKLFGHLIELKKRGMIKSLGVSVQNSDELEFSMANEHVEFIQLPFNILDWRWEQSKAAIVQEKQRRALVVHVRSIFLQGVLLSSDDVVWKKANVDDPVPIFRWLNDYCKRYECNDIGELCIRYVRSQSWIDGLVIGMETIQQLERNIKVFQKPLFTLSQLQAVEYSRPVVDNRVLNPAFWTNQ